MEISNEDSMNQYLDVRLIAEYMQKQKELEKEKPLDIKLIAEYMKDQKNKKIYSYLGGLCRMYGKCLMI